MNRLIVRLLALGAGAAAAAASAAPAAPAQAVCHRLPPAAPAMARLRSALAQGRFVTYQPTSLAVVNGAVTPADAAGIRADLTRLRPRFDSLITYDAIHGGEQIADLAAELEFRALIIGVWNPLDQGQLRAAAAAVRAHPQLIVGVSLGNELLFSRRSDRAALTAAIAHLRAQLPDTPLTVSEPFHVYGQEGAAPLLGELDFLLPIVHPLFQPWFHGATEGTAAQFVVNVVHTLAAGFCGPILVKETGLPTAPASAGFSEDAQAAFYRELRARFPSGRERAFAYFAAFDAPWRAYDAIAVPNAPPAVHPEEAHWGLFDAERNPKRAARELPPLPASRQALTSRRAPP
jgi:exo-beta-1,3-glucanase (GH17 family)